MIQEATLSQPTNVGAPCPGSPRTDLRSWGGGLAFETWESTTLDGLKIKIRQTRILLSICLGFATLSVSGQSPLSDSPNRSILHGAAVEYLFPEQVTVPAGKPSPVALHFRIAPGFHINSHTPKEDYLIPTSFSIPETSGVALKDAAYPDGTDFTLPLDPTTKLSIYTGEFAIQARIVAPRGNHLVQASLHYQACDKNACMPPKTITVPIDVIGN
jgi:DsbC/DsbD-like thiol-disulfide interchange protein